MTPSESKDNGMRCFNCGEIATNIHLCKSVGISQIICDECCQKLLKESRCQNRSCGHFVE